MIRSATLVATSPIATLARIPSGSILKLDRAILEAATTHNDLIREAHEIVVSELHARSDIAIIDDDLDAGRAAQR